MDAVEPELVRTMPLHAVTELYGEVFAFDVDSVSLHGRDGTTIHVSRAHVLYACYDPQDAD